MAGLVKAVLALKHRALPPALHLTTPNPRIDFEKLNLKLVQQYTTLEKPNDQPLTAGVNSFGFGGANAHVLLQEHRQAQKSSNTTTPGSNLHVPLVLSARSTGALRALAQSYATILRDTSAATLYDIAYAAAFQRERLEKNLGLLIDNPENVADLLEAYAENIEHPGIIQEDALPEKGSVAFVYSGNGSQWIGMGRALLEESPAFAKIFKQLDEAMRPLAGFSLLEELTKDGTQSKLDDTTVAQPLLFALQVAVTTILRDAGIHPKIALGHSVGEIAAAWASQALTLEQAISVICARSQAQGLTKGQGRMAAVGLSAASVRKVLSEADHVPDIEIAGINSPTNVTLAGSLESLDWLKENLTPRGVFFKLLDLDYAFHSHCMDSIEDLLVKQLATLKPDSAKEAIFVSTVTGQELEGSTLNASYWWRNVRQPVLFENAIKTATHLGCRIFIEIGPHAILQRYITESLASEKIRGRVLDTLKRGDDGAKKLADVVLRTHLLLADEHLKVFFPHPGQPVALPNYPWQRERHWHPQTSESLLVLERRRVHPLLGWRLPGAEFTWENTLDSAVLPWLADHQVGGVMVYPGAAYAEMALAAAREWLLEEHWVIEQLDILAPLVFDGEHGRTLRLGIHHRDGSFYIKSRQRLSHDEWTLHATGKILHSTAFLPTPSIQQVAPPYDREINQSQHYQLASKLGLAYGPAFQGLACARIVGATLEAELQKTDPLLHEDYFLHPGVFDACFQTLVDFFSQKIEAGNETAFLPVKIGRLDIFSVSSVCYLRAQLRNATARSVLVDFELFDTDHQLVATATGCRFRAAHLQLPSQEKITHWKIAPWVAPHPIFTEASPIPEIAALLAVALKETERAATPRAVWFRETLPLLEALTLSFGYEACQALASENKLDQLSKTHLGRWLAALLENEGVLQKTHGMWVFVESADFPPSRDLWQTLIREAPDCLSQLLMLGRIGIQWATLLNNPQSCLPLRQELVSSPVAENLFHTDPAYLGIRLAIEKVLHTVAHQWPRERRLRVLEISSGFTELPKTLLNAISSERLDYVLALSDERMQARLQAEYQGWPCVHTTIYSTEDLALAAEKIVPSTFDVIVLRHCLHKAAAPTVVLEQLQEKLAPGGLLLVAERYPDWSATLLEGLDPAAWRTPLDTPEGVLSALLPPTAWQQLLTNAGLCDLVLFEESAAQGLTEGAYLVAAKQRIAHTIHRPEVPVAHWALLADTASENWAQQLAGRLTAAGQLATVVPESQDLHKADHTVYLRGWSQAPCDAAEALSRLLNTVQQLARANDQPGKLWLIACGAALVQEIASELQPHPVQSALMGMGRVVMNECPQLACTLIDLAAPADDLLERIANELLYPDGTNEIILTRMGRYSPMVQEYEGAKPQEKTPSHPRYCLDFLVPGQLRNLLWRPQENAAALKPHEVEVKTHATGLNFRDVMYTMGLLPDEAVENGFAGASLGLEFSGVVTRLGSQVEHLHAGDKVMGFGASCFASHVITQADAVSQMPANWSFEAGATVPTVFLTVYYALKQLADLQPGERVLIHGGAGGVGIAAIQLAQHLGAEIYATAGSEEKRIFVHLLGADHVFDSRNLQFAEDILSATAGRGVDVVLNSLAGEAMRRSLDVLSPFGRFLELGKRDFFENTPIGLRPLKDNVSYFGIDADQLLNGRPKLAARLFQEVMALFHDRILAPLPYRTFPAERIVDAFRVMQQAKHIGKIVVTMENARPPLHVTALPAPPAELGQGTWLVTGGLSGFGLESVRWLVQRGVRHLVLVGRRGLQTPGAAEAIATLTAQGIQITVKACDISKEQAVKALMADLKDIAPSIQGVLHAAAQFDDRLLMQLDAESVTRVVDAKFLGAWNLHNATLHLPLTHFVLYSSVTTLIGNPGQANYVAANAGLEGLAALRRHLGLPATCIAWGPIGDAGYLVRNESIKDSLAQRLGKPPLDAANALHELDRIFSQEDAVATPANFDWSTLARLLPSASGSRFASLNLSKSESSTSQDAGDVRALIRGKSTAQTTALVQALVVQQVAQTLSVTPERIEPHASLHALGMDSLMAVELALGLERQFNIQLPVMMLNDAPTVQTVSARIIEKLIGTDASSLNDAAENLVAAAVLQHGAHLNEEQIKTLVEDTRTLAATGAELIE